MHYGTNAESKYNDYIKNEHLLELCGYPYDAEDYKIDQVVNSYFLKSALNMLRDYIDSIPKVQNGVENESDKVSYFRHEIFKIENLIERIETYLDYISDPESKIESERESERETEGETEGETKG